MSDEILNKEVQEKKASRTIRRNVTRASVNKFPLASNLPNKVF